MMRVTTSQVEHVLRAIENSRALFNSHVCDETHVPFYHLQADALCWADEIPGGLNFEASRVVQFLLAARSQSYSESVMIVTCLFEELRTLVPEWAFLLQDRHQSKWLEQLEILREESLKNFETELKNRKHSLE